MLNVMITFFFSYKLLHVLEFDSTRKRMSVIVSESDGMVYRSIYRQLKPVIYATMKLFLTLCQ